MMGAMTASSGAARRHHNRPPPPPGKKKRKGMWSFCGPTLYTMGVVCCMWLPKVFLIIGIILSILGIVFLILSSQPSLKFDGTTSGACMLAFGLLFVLVSSIGIYVKKMLKNMPDVEQSYQVTFGPGRKYVVEGDDVSTRATSEASSDSSEKVLTRKIDRPKTAPSTRNGTRPTSARNTVTIQPKASVNTISQPSAASVMPGTSTGGLTNSGPSTLKGDKMLKQRPTSAPNNRPVLSNRRAQSANSGSRPTSANNSRQTSNSPRYPENNKPASAKQNGRAKGMQRASSTEPIEEEEPQSLSERDSVTSKEGPPFVTETSGKMNGSVNLETTEFTVEVHPPPSKPQALQVPAIVSSFSNDGFEEEDEAMIENLVGLHPFSSETMDEIIARSPMPSPRTPRAAHSPRSPRPTTPRNSPRQATPQTLAPVVVCDELDSDS